MLVLGEGSKSPGLKENLPTSPLTLGSAVSTAGPEKQSPRERPAQEYIKSGSQEQQQGWVSEGNRQREKLGWVAVSTKDSARESI